MPRRTLTIFFIFTIAIPFLVSCLGIPEKIVDNSDTPMVLIPAGDFEMTVWNELKNESTIETVYVDNFYLDIYKVTNQHYADCVRAGACAEPLNTKQYAQETYRDHPVIFVTCEMANTYCRWREARLPTKAEWEKAAQDELEEVDYYWGEESPVCQVGSRLGRSVKAEINFYPDTKPIGSTTPNMFGLYEMTGGMWEWVQDEHPLDVYTNPPEVVSFLRINRWSGYGPLYARFLCSFRCARSP